MSLTLVATPIGNHDDISIRALQLLKDAPVIIGEEYKEVSKLLKRLGINEKDKQIELLNEHTSDKELKELLHFCRLQNVALVSDCGTPVFCDPGARLIQLCRKEGVTTRAVPGASSLMVLLSLSSENLESFLFRGFLPAKSEDRAVAIDELKRETQAVVLMDTPYRLHRLLEDLEKTFPDRKMLLAMNLTTLEECIIEGTACSMRKQNLPEKAEFMILLYPTKKRK